jgi:hypothetical protein
MTPSTVFLWWQTKFQTHVIQRAKLFVDKTGKMKRYEPNDNENILILIKRVCWILKYRLLRNLCNDSLLAKAAI